MGRRRQPKWTPIPREQVETVAAIMGESSACASALRCAAERFEGKANFYNSDDGRIIVEDAREVGHGA